MTKCSVPHNREISGGRRSEGARESGNMKQVRSLQAKVKDMLVEGVAVVIQAAELQPVKV